MIDHLFWLHVIFSKIEIRKWGCSLGLGIPPRTFSRKFATRPASLETIKREIAAKVRNDNGQRFLDPIGEEEEERSGGKDKDDRGSRRGRKVWICADIGR